MISSPPPKFEAQKSEILQRYQILSEDNSAGALCLADSIALALKVPYVITALNRRYRTWYHCEHGVDGFPLNDIQTYFARMHLFQSRFDVADITEGVFLFEPYVQLGYSRYSSFGRRATHGPKRKAVRDIMHCPS